MKLKDKSAAQLWLGKNGPTAMVLACGILIFLLLRLWAAPAETEGTGAVEFAEYDRGMVLQVLADSTEADPASDGAYRGEQLLLVEVRSGRYQGEALQVSNFVGPLYGVPVYQGDPVMLTISTYADGSHTAVVFEYDRTWVLAAAAALFLLAAALVGGKTGCKSLAGLAITLATLFGVLLPMLLRGAPTLPAVFLVCVYVAVMSLTILGGIRRKTVCAMLGTVAGTALAMIFAMAVQHFARIDGLRLDDVEPMLQLRQQGANIGLRGLLTGGIVISALGAVMDVTMGIASAVCEIHDANPDLDRRSLFRSGMNVGRDMVGTMTNTLVLAFLGSSFTLILYLYSMDLSANQLISSAYFSVELISSLSSSIGVILSIPITALISAGAFAAGAGKKRD